MKIAIDVSPLESGHKVRGVGFYLKNLKQALEEYHPEHTYIFFTDAVGIPRDIDVIHYPYFDPFFATLPLRKKAKTVVTVHDLTPIVFPNAFPAGIKGNLRWQRQKLALKGVNAVIVDSEASKKDVLRFVGIDERKVHVIYLAAGDEYSQSKGTAAGELRKKYHLPERYALYVGDVTWNKNVPRIIEAAKAAEIPLVLVGKALTETDFDRSNPWNSDRVKIETLVKDAAQLYRLGFLPSEDVIGLYKAAEVFLMPSLYEGFGLPILEAMTCGTPVITAKRGSIPEVAGEAALYADPEDTDAIADSLKKVFSDTVLRRELTEKGKKQAAKFSWKKTAQETLQVYESV